MIQLEIEGSCGWFFALFHWDPIRGKHGRSFQVRRLLVFGADMKNRPDFFSSGAPGPPLVAGAAAFVLAEVGAAPET